LAPITCSGFFITIIYGAFIVSTAIIGFSGAHGTGKSTVLQAIAAKALPGIVVDTRSISRKVQNDWGLSLEEITCNVQHVIRFQEEILSRKHDHLIELMDQNSQADVIYTDRTPMDLAAYASLWTQENPGFNHWLKNYVARCVSDMKMYTKTVLFPVSDFGFAAESERASHRSQKPHQELCDHFALSYMNEQNCVTLPVLTIEDRVEWCLHYANSHVKSQKC
jgi:predicted ATPase